MMALGDALKKYWGAVGRDLLTAGFTWDDIGSERCPVDQFIAFVAHAPPNTALYHARSKGWLVTDHLVAQAVDALNYLAWAKTADAQLKNPKHRPDQIARPGKKGVSPKATEKSMSVADYAARAGLNTDFGEE